MRALRETPQRRDPAPSRWAYRLNRMWLTPAFRLAVRAGLPLALTAAVAGLWMADAGRRQALFDTYAELRSEFQNRPEFMVNLVSIEGASPLLAEAIRAGLGFDLPKSSFGIDLGETRALVETFDAVERADLRIVAGGVLQINVTERLPALVWRAPDGVWLVDAGGHRVARIGARSLRGDLPLIAGEGAAASAPEALALVQAAGPLVPRLRGLVRMGERRWDLVLDRDQRILLPEDNPVRALERLIALDQAEGILSRDITAVDLRSDRRPTLRLSAEGADTLRQIRLAQTGG
ncbi:cell division protein FtsQ/DivIB [Gemmobacter nectariphilus]|uniref:cell division protein FtsQ/DivIB n=1 Tax=Gemmobacter nectariphilus TaxID=220343 RepID=UPI00040AD5B1|nr:cell division protein FtsQ/DivIB [Gemmobacter nectariphilus]